MAPVSRRGNLQYFADRLDPVSIPMLIDIGVYDFSLRSSSAWAKKALAVRRMSLARRSSLFSRSSSFRRCASAVVVPGRSPASTSARLTHSSSVCGTQPIFGAIDSTAAQSDGYSPRCSCTSRTARSRTSGENLFDLVMAPFSQIVEPPRNPGRFTGARCSLSTKTGVEGRVVVYADGQRFQHVNLERIRDANYAGVRNQLTTTSPCSSPHYAALRDGLR